MKNSTLRPTRYSFEFEGQILEFDYQGKEAINRATGETVTYDGSLFSFYFKELLDAAATAKSEQDRMVAFDDIPSNLAWSDHNVALRDLRNLLVPLIGERGRLRLLPRGKKSDRGTLFHLAVPEVSRTSHTGATSLLVEGDDPMQVYNNMNALRARGEAEVSQLMRRLTALFPAELEGFFFRTNQGTILPFHHMDDTGSGRLTWPLKVLSDDEASPGKERHEYSLKDQRWLEGARMYNGHIYQLMQANGGSWVLGRTRYFDVLDACDFLRDRVLADWGRVCDDPSTQVQNRALEGSAHVQEWLENVKAIRRGDFSTYAAGIAMNMPIFASQNGKMHLLMGKGAVEKATGGGKYHVCPAGMLEFFKNNSAEELSFRDFRTYLVKELYEEGFKHPFLTDETTQNVLQGNLPLKESNSRTLPPADEDFGDYVSTKVLEDCFDRTEDLLRQGSSGLASALSLSEQARSITEQTRSYQILDAFRLRPEIITPLFTNDLPELFLGWEYKGYIPDNMPITSMDALEAMAKEDMAQWAEPGLAGVYLALRDHFAGK